MAGASEEGEAASRIDNATARARDEHEGIEADDHANVNAAHQGTTSPKPQPEAMDSYFDVKTSEQEENGEHEEPAGLGNITPARPAKARTTTAPVESGARPSTIPRRSALLGAMKRGTTESGRNQNQRAPYSYTFDPMSSSESSSSEDEAAAQRKKQKKSKSKKGTQKPKPPRQTDDRDFADEEQIKQRAKQGQSYSRFAMANEHIKSKGRISKRDGRLNISMNETNKSGYVAKALGQSLRHHFDVPSRKQRNQDQREREHEEDGEAEPEPTEGSESIAASLRTQVTRPRLNIVIMVIGSRGDIQPFLKIGQIMQNQYGHRVRIASHPTFRDFVTNEIGLEFFSIGGDPSELMAFMVKNPGLIPNLQTLREGEIKRRRAAMAIMFEGFWRACINATDDEKDLNNVKMMGARLPFVADAIIANPPSMAHVHIAEKLGIPLHIMFTFPYTPTQAFPHPLANIQRQKSNVDESYINFMSYPLVEMMTWQGLGDIVNKFREETLDLEPVSSLWAPGALYRMKVPYTYMWSPSLVPKPKDWGPEIDLAGFVFLDLASNFKPPKELEDFLNEGDPPVYIGFGSIVVDDPNAFTDLIFKATKMAGVRALVNKGWGGLGQDGSNTPDHIYMLGNTPHDWLFPKVKAVVHHGGAGTTAIGLKCAKPTMIVPFFGDQPFWGTMVAEAKAGAHQCIPYKRLTAELLAEGIKQCLSEESQINVQKIADSIVKEGDGAANAVKSFHRSLPLAGQNNMRCSILEDRAAVWQLRHSSLRLSALAAELLQEKGKLKWSDMKLLRHVEWNDFDGPGEPVTGVVGAVTDSVYDIGAGMGMVPVRIARHMKKHDQHERKKDALRRKRAQKKKIGLTKQGPTEKELEQASQPTDQRPSVSREQTNTTMGSTISADPSEGLPEQLAGDVGIGFKRSGAALLTMPNDLHVAIAQGFHNAPRLWGDATVRKPVRITGFKSGCEAAGKEFTYGLYDGWSGLVTQPMGDWRDADTLPAKVGGLGVGVGKGLGGFVMKNVSAVVAPPAFFGKGLIKYMGKKIDGPGVKGYIRKAHIIQGQRDKSALQKQDSKDGTQQLQRIQDHVDDGWRTYQEIWATAHHIYHRGNGKHKMVGKYRFGREKKQWNENGALENIQTAKRALRYRKGGYDINELFAQRRKEMREAERPRASALQQPDVFEEKAEVLPNGRKTKQKTEQESTFAGDEAEREKLGPQDDTADGQTDGPVSNGKKEGDAARAPTGEAANRHMSAVSEEEDNTSDTTVVASSSSEESDDKSRRTPGATGVDKAVMKGVPEISAPAPQRMMSA